MNSSESLGGAWRLANRGLTRAAPILSILASSAAISAQTPLETLRSFDLDTARVGRVTAFFAPDDRGRAMELAGLTDEARIYLEREFGIASEIGLAALAPQRWFSDLPGMAYGMPWPAVPERVIFMPSSLQEGLLVEGDDEIEDRRRVDFVLLHEYGHIAAKLYFRPASDADYLPVQWFDELLATCFAYGFVRESNPEWADEARVAWRTAVSDFVPDVISLDWGFMNDLPGDELVSTYAWYQYMLNLRAAEIYELEGPEFLRKLKAELPWEDAGGWTTESLLPLLEAVSPGFEEWAVSLPGAYREGAPR